MKAEDTVMSANNIATMGCGEYDNKCNFVLRGMQIPKVLSKQAEISFNAGIQQVLEWANKWKEVAEHGDYSNGVEAFGVDEGRVLTYRYIKDLEEQWQAKLKEWGIV